MLFIGGTGTISLASTRLLAERGVELTVLNRGLSGIRLPEGVGELRADVGNREAVAEAVFGLEFDVVVNWLADVPAGVEVDIGLFRGRVAQYVFNSSATVYPKPSPFFPIVEDAPLGLRYPEWPYAHNKILLRVRRAHDRRRGAALVVRAAKPLLATESGRSRPRSSGLAGRFSTGCGAGRRPSCPEKASPSGR